MILMANAMMGAAGYQAAAGGEWWLAGGAIDPGNVVAVYEPATAATFLDSLENIVDPGVLTLGYEPGFEPAIGPEGWFFDPSIANPLTLPLTLSGELSIYCKAQMTGDNGTSDMYVLGLFNNYHGRYLAFNCRDHHSTYGWERTTAALGGAPGVVMFNHYTYDKSFVLTRSSVSGQSRCYCEDVMAERAASSDPRNFLIGSAWGRFKDDHYSAGLVGHIKEVAVFNVELSALQVAELKDARDLI